MDNEVAAVPEEPDVIAFDQTLIEAFCKVTSSSRDEAFFFLESHKGDLNAAVSTFFESGGAITTPAASSIASPLPPYHSPSPTHSVSPSYSRSASMSPSRSRSHSPPISRFSYDLRPREHVPSFSHPPNSKPSSGRTGGVHTLSDLNKMALDGADDSDSDGPPEYYTGGSKSGMLVQDPSKNDGMESFFNQARLAGAVERPPHASSSSSSSFTGIGRSLTVDTGSPSEPEAVNHTITFWTNGFTVNEGGPLRRLDDPQNASFLESITKGECPKELDPADKKKSVICNLVRRNEKYSEPIQPRVVPFKGVGRTLGSSMDVSEQAAPSPSPSPSPYPLPPSPSPSSSSPSPSVGMVVDETLPVTSIQMRLGDGTRMVARFNYHHTIRDVRAFIDASRPRRGAGVYSLQTVGFPPKQLVDEGETIQQAGLANSVIIQKF